ncbi:MAG: YeeE/YedE family protein [Sideroxydans sp.]
MKRNIASALAGMVFGFGLALAGMTHPEKVLGFLDVAGTWDASLLFVLGGAVCVTLITFRFILKLHKPLLAEQFVITKDVRIDRPLIVGAALFGVGWGISGYCPGPAVALIATPNWELWAFLPAAIVGGVAEKYFAFHHTPEPEIKQDAAIVENASESSCG